MKYPVMIKTVSDGYECSAPDIVGCMVLASGIESGLDKLEIAVEEHLQILAEYGESIPRASNIDTQRVNHPSPAIVWAVIDIDITPFLGKSHKINVTLPELLIKKIDDCVSRNSNYTTRSGFIAQACINELTKKTYD
ncbi:type II toxin-antitoxin system HicB family antitoxin [Thalassotalea agarivorans]|uniref:Predicted nuclease of the RNAse H fold, HicB family n=1 Tax=Thalassotalea agarivorans TaxID=349064 RepID=A0A1I0F1Z7_THASX|nr:type II toxin-antitoxin system HicB family antitoxin [Thalassotalea agarivorans]SET52025.1 Predicted nuclease of the RNAse H fold, HicB family [Thalassotalea agarivorans]